MGEVLVCGWLEGFCFPAGRLGAGLGLVLEEDEVEVELEVELEELEVELEDEELELELELLELNPDPTGEVLELDVVLDELLLSGTQFSVSDVTTPITGGSFRLESCVPGATSGSVKVKVWPPSTVIETVQVSAEAAGAERPARAIRRLLASASTTSSFRLLTESLSS